jgi:benzoate membrane transport protein
MAEGLSCFVDIARRVGQDGADRAPIHDASSHDVSSHDVSIHDASSHDVSSHDASRRRYPLATTSRDRNRNVPALVAGLTVAIVFLAVLSIVLTAAGRHGLALSDRRASGWIALIYGVPMIPSLVLTLRYRIPLLLTGNVFALIFFVSLGDRVTYEEIAGATILAGAIVLLTAVLGLTGQLARWIPAPIVQGLIAGAVMPFFVGAFSALQTSGDQWRVAVMVGAAVVGYLVGQRVLGTRLPPILPAFLAGFFAAMVTGQLGEFPSTFTLPSFELLRPSFSAAAILTVAPVLLALMTVQSNVPSVIYLRGQGFDPPERLLNLVSGGATLLVSAFGPVAVSLALPPLLVTAGPSAGERSLRYRAVFVPVAAGLAIALFAAVAADLAQLIPSVLLLAIAGLALVPALVAALKAISAGPIVLGPLFAFAIALSKMTIFGLGPFFWSLVIGTAVSMLLERDGMKELRERTMTPPAEGASPA